MVSCLIVELCVDVKRRIFAIDGPAVRPLEQTVYLI
jgi:hypothetical protein